MNTPNEPEVELKLAIEHGLNEEEYKKILKILGRIPTYTELGIFSVMWSEHCSYKNSIKLLKTLPRSGGKLLVGAGEENAGAVDIGDGLAVVFKIESHNHPSAVEPYEGAATGVGGILRDIFTMGARPIAALDSLRFGSLSKGRTRYLLDGVVRGIGGYGNCFGVPTVGGEIYFEEAYSGNPLINAMAVGIVKTDKMASATANGAGNPVLVVGSSTGRDGIHGATFASEELSEKSQARRPAVQIGDPFTEKLLLEATLEIIDEDLIVGIQDMGAAGITCSSSEMSEHGKSGMELHLDKVPVREEGMTPYEIMLSESQERMLVVAKKDKVERIQEIFKKWGLHSVVIGKVIDENKLKVFNGETVCAEIPPDTLVLGGGAPVYTRKTKKPDYIDKINKSQPRVAEPDDYNKTLLKLLSSPNICSKRWVYEQYDYQVRTNTVITPGGDAAVMRIRKTDKAISLATDCNGRYCYIDPYNGAQMAVAEAARNVCCTGALPIAITNCLNFGNPYDEEVYWYFSECVRGMKRACLAFDTPVTGGNVSFYNESGGTAVYPTPVIGMLGLIDDISKVTTSYFKDKDDVILLLGELSDKIGGSEYLKTVHNKTVGPLPNFDINLEKRVQRFLRKIITERLVKSAHDVSDGGLAVTLAECCINRPNDPIGCEVDVIDKRRFDKILFSEAPSRIIVSCNFDDVAEIERLAFKSKVPMQIIGIVGGSKVIINDYISLTTNRLKKTYEEALPKQMRVR
ncbi:MAG: phosphoribosylformylglycinamidine synthase subunit PurL [candidate division Zixibacteria bacterium]|nr:phosphoribosylformylglycinamidine synthase subunit PurL [candidate division Zixibacteria bacterium]